MKPDRDTPDRLYQISQGDRVNNELQLSRVLKVNLVLRSEKW
jgi:hypothetical protein